MKKRMVLLFMMIITFLFLSSCVQETYNFNLTNNGGAVKHEQVVTKSVYDMIISNMAPSEREQEGVEVSFFTENDTEYAKITRSQKFNSLEELNSYLSQLGAQAEEGSQSDISDAFFTTIQVNVDESDKTLSIVGQIAKQDSVSSYTSCDVIFKFPGKIISFDIGEEIDSNTIKINMLELWKSSSTATFTLKSEAAAQINYIVPVILVAVFIIAVCVIVVIFKKRKVVLNDTELETTNNNEL